jgi:hypothetical protein
MRIKFIALVISSILLTTGCGGSGNQTSSHSNGLTNPSTSKDFVFMSDLRAYLSGRGIECSGYEQNQEVIGAKEEGTCKYKGTDITLDLFGDSKTAKAILDALKGFGGYTISSNNWSISTSSETVAKEIAKTLSLEVQ